jgi:glycosyltransferase involved in cell wall biosynthesis
MIDPEATVVIPTRDRWELLSSHALVSALDQVDVALEVIVVDDGSTDVTRHGLEQIGDPRLRVLRHDVSRGVASARNAGLSAARGEWIAFLDDDDLWSPRKLRAQLEMAHMRSVDFVYAKGVLVDKDKRVLAADIFVPENELRARLRTSNVIPGGCSNVMAKTDLVRKVGGFDETLTYTEDWDLWIRLVETGRSGACQEVLVAHVEHLDNALFRYRPDVASEVEYVLSKHNPDADGSQVRALRLQTLEWMAHEFRRAGYRREAARLYVQIARERRGVGDLARALVILSGTRGEASARMLRRAFSRSNVGGELPVPSVPDWLERYKDPGARLEGP